MKLVFQWLREVHLTSILRAKTNPRETYRCLDVEYTTNDESRRIWIHLGRWCDLVTITRVGSLNDKEDPPYYVYIDPLSSYREPIVRAQWVREIHPTATRARKQTCVRPTDVGYISREESRRIYFNILFYIFGCLAISACCHIFNQRNIVQSAFA